MKQQLPVCVAMHDFSYHGLHKLHCGRDINLMGQLSAANVCITGSSNRIHKTRIVAASFHNDEHIVEGSSNYSSFMYSV